MASPVSLHERTLYENVWSNLGEYSKFSPGKTYVPIFKEYVGVPPIGPVLDAGCGRGDGAAALLAEGYQVAACDIMANPDVCHPDILSGTIPFIATSLWDRVNVSKLPFLASLHLSEFANRQWFDAVYCCDVMEHIPTEYTMLVVDNLASICTKGLFFSIALVPDQFGMWVGESLHKTVQPFTWWRDRLKEFGTVEGRDLLNTGIYWVAK